MLVCAYSRRTCPIWRALRVWGSIIQGRDVGTQKAWLDVKDAPKIPRNKAPPGNAARARDEAYPCKCKYPTSVDEAARARKANVHWFCDRVSLHCIADPSHISR